MTWLTGKDSKHFYGLPHGWTNSLRAFFYIQRCGSKQICHQHTVWKAHSEWQSNVRTWWQKHNNSNTMTWLLQCCIKVKIKIKNQNITTLYKIPIHICIARSDLIKSMPQLAPNAVINTHSHHWFQQYLDFHHGHKSCYNVAAKSYYYYALDNSTDQCMHSETPSCSHAPRHSAAIPLHASMLPSSPCHLHEAAVLDHAACGVTTAHWPAPVMATAEPIENSAATEGRHLTASELDSLFQWNKDCSDT